MLLVQLNLKSIKIITSWQLLYNSGLQIRKSIESSETRTTVEVCTAYIISIKVLA